MGSDCRKSPAQCWAFSILCGIERDFADAKEKHGMRYTRYTGLAQVTNWVKLKFAAMNLKKFAIRKWEDTHNLLQILVFWPAYVQNPIQMDGVCGGAGGI